MSANSRDEAVVDRPTVQDARSESRGHTGSVSNNSNASNIAQSERELVRANVYWLGVFFPLDPVYSER